MQSELKEVMHALSHLSSTLPGDTTCLALTAPASPCRHGRQEHKNHHKELERLRTEVALLRVRRTTCLYIHLFQTAKLITFFALTCVSQNAPCVVHTPGTVKVVMQFTTVSDVSPTDARNACLFFCRHRGRYSKLPAVAIKLQMTWKALSRSTAQLWLA